MAADACVAHVSVHASAEMRRNGRIRGPCGTGHPRGAARRLHRSNYVVWLQEVPRTRARSTPCIDAPQSGPHLPFTAVRRWGVAWVLCAIALAIATPARAAASLPSVPSGARPGPELLYAPAADAPQLQNTGVWHAPPILVSGAEAYRDGEFVYQDFLFDDHGATGSADDPNDPFNQVENMFAPKHGTLSYPTDTATFANNAADLVELRVKPLPTATAFRVTLNTLKAPDRTAFTIALGDAPAPVPWPHGAGVSSPAQLFLTVPGNHADLLNAATGQPLTPAPTASVDLSRRQIDVRIPHAAWDPGTSTVR